MGMIECFDKNSPDYRIVIYEQLYDHFATHIVIDPATGIDLTKVYAVDVLTGELVSIKAMAIETIMHQPFFGEIQ